MNRAIAKQQRNAMELGRTAINIGFKAADEGCERLTMDVPSNLDGIPGSQYILNITPASTIHENPNSYFWLRHNSGKRLLAGTPGPTSIADIVATIIDDSVLRGRLGLKRQIADARAVLDAAGVR